MGIGSWLEKRAIKAQQDEVAAFLLSLKGADAFVIDSVAAATMTYGKYFEGKGKDVYNMAYWIAEKEFMAFPLEIGYMIRVQQQQKTVSSTPGLMVWLFSARALLEPQLRLSGRELWSELARATDESEELAEDMCEVMNLPSAGLDRYRIPIGLEVLQR
ncbi:MAG: hypothetical protein C0457_17930 [Polymorphum sp.]|nr:hypothetical protein [Polymorphum sp.]